MVSGVKRERTGACVVEGCARPDDGPRGMCFYHYRKSGREGSRQRLKTAADAPCSIEGCGRPSDSLGLCRVHYARQYKHGTTELLNRVGDKRSHPYYALWFERKTAGTLCAEWLNFKAFLAGIGTRPEAPCRLIRKDADRPFGPDNFEWHLTLQREPHETDQEWWSRKWADRQKRHPKSERHRHLLRHYDLTEAEYDAKLAEQGGVCAICHQPELEGRTLAVDHCHTTKRVRDLLCFRCNVMVGRVEKQWPLIEAARRYVERHAEEIADGP